MKRLIPIVLATVACGPSDPVSPVDSTPVDPLENCDYFEYDTGPNSTLLTAPLVATLPALSERIVCGEFSNEFNYPTIVYDYDGYLFPMVSSEGVVVTNFDIRTAATHTPLMEVYYVNETLEEPMLVGSFVGSPGYLYVLDWPFFPLDTIKNDLIVQISGFSTATNPSAAYELRFW